MKLLTISDSDIYLVFKTYIYRFNASNRIFAIIPRKWKFCSSFKIEQKLVEKVSTSTTRKVVEAEGKNISNFMLFFIINNILDEVHETIVCNRFTNYFLRSF